MRSNHTGRSWAPPVQVATLRLLSIAAATIALSCSFSSQLTGQAAARRTVSVTLVQMPFADGTIAAVISPQPDGRVRILLPMDPKPEQLLTAVAVLDSKRLPLVPSTLPTKAIVINRVVAPHLPVALEARLRSRLESLKRQEVRDLEGVGRVRSITLPLSLASPR